MSNLARSHDHPGAHPRTWELSAANVAPGVARAAVRDYLAVLDLPEQLVNDVMVCVSEAVTNAVMHAYPEPDGGGRVEIAAILDGDLCITVCDSGSGMAPRPVSGGAGLGLPLIANLASRLEVSADEAGTTVQMWFTLPRGLRLVQASGSRRADPPAPRAAGGPRI